MIAVNIIILVVILQVKILIQRKGGTLAEYFGVLPVENIGSHRFVFLVYAQRSRDSQ